MKVSWVVYGGGEVGDRLTSFLSDSPQLMMGQETVSKCHR